MALPPKSDLDKLLELVSNPFRDNFNQKSIVASVGSSIATTALIFLAWCLIRPHNTIVYAPKVRHTDEKHAPPRLESGIFAWVKPLWNAKEEDLVDKIGVDAVLFLRVLRMCMTIMGVLGFLGVAAMIPVNVVMSKKSTKNWQHKSDDPLVLMTPRDIFGRGIWAQVVMAWVFDLIIIYILWVNYKAVARLRKNYFESEEYQVALNSRTLMITDIPENYRSDDGLAQIIRGMGVPSRSDENFAIGRAVKDLPDLIEQHNEAVYDLEAVLAKYLKDPDNLPASRPTCKPKKGDTSIPKGMRVDAIDYLYQRVHELERLIRMVRETVDMRDAEQYGFVSYRTISQAHVVALAAKGKRVHGTTVQLAPKPQDVIWENLRRNKKQRNWNAFMGNVFFVLLSIGFILPNAFIAVFLSDISRIAMFWPAFARNFYENQKFWAFVQGFITPVITSIIYLLLPIVMRRLSKWQGDLKKTSRERHVTAKLYAFFIFNNLIVFTIFSTMWEFVTVIIDEANNKRPGHRADIWDAILKYKLATQITRSVFGVSPFWMMYLLQRNMGAVLDLAQIVSLLWGSLARKLFCPTPRQIINHTAPPTFDYATYYNYFLFYFSIALVFATLQPLMLVVAFLYFLVDGWLKKYLLMYVFVTKIESGGAFWRLLFNRFIFATIFANIVVACVVWVQYDTSYAWAWIVPLPVILIGFKVYCMRTFDGPMHYHTKSSDRNSMMADDSSLQGSKPLNGGRRSEKLRTRFGHPALYRPLIHPMVRAKAQHILDQVYQGRKNSDLTNQRPGTTYGEIDLEAMERGYPGKKLEGSKANMSAPQPAVDFVEESEMDFAQWKHRPGFAEDHAEMYSLRSWNNSQDGFRTPPHGQGLRGATVDGSNRSSFASDEHPHIPGLPRFQGSGSRPQSPLSSGFIAAPGGGKEYFGVPAYTPPSGSRSQSPQQLGVHHQQPVRATSPLHMYPPTMNSAMEYDVRSLNSIGPVIASGSGSGGGDGDSMKENLLGHSASIEEMGWQQQQPQQYHPHQQHHHQYPPQSYQQDNSNYRGVQNHSRTTPSPGPGPLLPGGVGYDEYRRPAGRR